MNDKAVYRTAPATPGLLNNMSTSISKEIFEVGSITFCYIDVHSSAANWSLGQIYITSIQIGLIFFLFFILGFQKRIASICLEKIHKGYMFLKA